MKEYMIRGIKMLTSTTEPVIVSVQNGIQIIKFNNPKKKNALSLQAYKIIINGLEDGIKNPNVLVTVFTGEGDFYSSGFDITDPEIFENSDRALEYVRTLIATLIDYPKLLIAVVNGPAIGLTVTTLGLCDIVYASDKATFQTPFSKLGLCAEGCASYTFPRILGKSKASEMLYIGHKMLAKEAYQFGFVSEVFDSTEVHKIWEKIQGFTEISQSSILFSKKMCKHFDRAKLHEANKMELDNLVICFKSEDFGNSMIKFMTRKAKL